MIQSIGKVKKITPKDREYKFILYTFEQPTDLNTDECLEGQSIVFISERYEKEGEHRHNILYAACTNDLVRVGSLCDWTALNEKNANCIGILLIEDDMNEAVVISELLEDSHFSEIESIPTINSEKIHFLQGNEDYFEKVTAENKIQVVKDKIKEFFNMKNVHYTETTQESRAINDMPSPMIIISASGMADAGRVLHHLKHNLWRKDSSVIFAGYQAEGSLGRRLIEGAKKVRIMGEEISVGAKIYNMTGFSAHADKNQMLKLYKGMMRKPKAFFVVHGEYDSASAFADLLRTELGTAAYIPNYGDTAVIEGTEWRIEPSQFILKEPAAQEVMDALRGLEKVYLTYKARIMHRVMQDVSKVPDIKVRIGKVKKFIDDLFKNI